MTSLDVIPPLGLEKKIEVEFHDDDNPNFFADTCSFILRIPTVHKEIEDFMKKLSEAGESYLGHGSL